MNLVPLRLSISPLPPGFTGTPQDVFDALEARAQIVTDQAYSLFVVGSVAPSSDEGPFWLNGITPYVWDVTTGAYIPVVLAQKSLRYGIFPAGSLPASNADYDVVFSIDPASTPAGNPLSVNLWYNGAWTDVYANTLSNYPTLTWLAANYFTQAQTTAAIAAAVGAVTNYMFRVNKGEVNQAYTGNSGSAQVTFGQTEWNLDSDASHGWQSGTNTFVAPVQGYYTFTAAIEFLLASGSPTNVTFQMYIRKNSTTSQWAIASSPSVGGAMGLVATATLHLAAGDTVDVAAQVDGTGASTWNIVGGHTQSNLSGQLVRAG